MIKWYDLTWYQWLLLVFATISFLLAASVIGWSVAVCHNAGIPNEEIVKPEVIGLKGDCYAAAGMGWSGVMPSISIVYAHYETLIGALTGLYGVALAVAFGKE